MNKLKSYLEDTGTTLQELAATVGASKSYICDIKNGNKFPSFRLACRIERATGGAVSLTDWQEGAAKFAAQPALKRGDVLSLRQESTPK